MMIKLLTTGILLLAAIQSNAFYQEPRQEMNGAFFREIIAKSSDSGETFSSIIDFFQRGKDSVYQFQFKYPLFDKKQADAFAKVLEIKGQEAHRFVPVFEDCQFVRPTHLGYERKAQVANGPILWERALIDKPSKSVLFVEEREVLPNGEIIEGGFIALNSVIEEEGNWYFAGTYLYNESATPEQADAREEMFRKTYENMLSFIEGGQVDVVYEQLQRY